MKKELESLGNIAAQMEKKFTDTEDSYLEMT